MWEAGGGAGVVKELVEARKVIRELQAVSAGGGGEGGGEGTSGST